MKVSKKKRLWVHVCVSYGALPLKEARKQGKKAEKSGVMGSCVKQGACFLSDLRNGIGPGSPDHGL